MEFDAAARTAAIDEALEAVVADPLHPDRARLEAHFDTLGVLPAATFDVVVRCAENPAVAVEAAIAAPNGAALGRRWRAFEELPFSWDLVPVATWVAAAKRLRDAFEGRPFDPLLAFASFLSEAGILPGTRPMWENRANLPEFARYAAACMVEAITGALPERCPLRLPRDVVEEPIRAGIVDAKGQLLIRRREDDWPDADLPPLKELERWFPEIPDRAVPHRNAALRAPLLVAGVLAGVVDRSVGQHHLYDLARLRAFDPTWYDQARDHALALLLVLPARGARR